MLIYRPDLNNSIDQKIIGGKAENLDILRINGFNVPGWFVITTEAFKQVFGDSLKELVPDKIREKIINTDIPEYLLSEITQTLEDMNLKCKYLAVRSSGLEEDGLEKSFAGQFDSYLYVKANDIEEKIKKVWASAFSDRILSYNRDKADFSVGAIGVIVQEMVDSDVAGVAFKIDPVTGNRNAVVISTVLWTWRRSCIRAIRC